MAPVKLVVLLFSIVANKGGCATHLDFPDSANHFAHGNSQSIDKCVS